MGSPGDDALVVGLASAAGVLGTLALAFVVYKRRSRGKAERFSLSFIEFGGRKPKQPKIAGGGQTGGGTFGSKFSSFFGSSGSKARPKQDDEESSGSSGKEGSGEPVLAPSKNFLLRMQTLEAEVDELIGGGEEKKPSNNLSEIGESQKETTQPPAKEKVSRLATKEGVGVIKPLNSPKQVELNDSPKPKPKPKLNQPSPVIRPKKKKQVKGLDEDRPKERGKEAEDPNGKPKDAPREKKKPQSPKQAVKAKVVGEELAQNPEKGRKRRRGGNGNDDPVTAVTGAEKKGKPRRKQKGKEKGQKQPKEPLGRQDSETSTKGKEPEDLDALEAMIAPSLEYKTKGLAQPRPISFGEYVPKRRRRKLSSEHGSDGVEVSNPKYVKAQVENGTTARPRSTYLSRLRRASSTRSLFRPSSMFLSSFSTTGSPETGKVQRQERRKKRRKQKRKPPTEEELEEAI